MHILVTGGDGFIGRVLCRELHERGHEVRALARDPDPDVLPEGVETVAGDVTDPESLESAFEGVDAVANLVALSPMKTPAGGNAKHEQVHTKGTENILDVAQSAGLNRIVQMSALGADPEGATAYIRAKGKAEAVVRESDLEWVILRPSVVFGEGGQFIEFTKTLIPPLLAPLPGGGRNRFQPIWVGDLAPMVADALTEPDKVGQTYELGGPQKLSLAEIGQLLRDTVVVLPVPMGLAKAGLAIAEIVPNIPMGLDQYRSLQFDNTTDDNDVTAFGVKPPRLKTLESYLSERN